MNIIIERFNKIQSNISKLNNSKSPKIVAVSKTFSLDHIMPLIEYGHNHFGENKVQEAEAKWLQIKKEKKNLQLHMIGKLQSNKAKQAVKIFDYIHSLDSQKLADILSKSQNEINKSINYFIQVNIGNEKQKSGINYNEVDQFYNYCSKEKKMNILGLMAIPPQDENTEKYFKSLSDLNSSLGLTELSMGMSSDYIHSLDSQKLADILFKSQSEINKSLNYFIQVNIGNEKQKSGINYNEVDQFYNYCTKEKKMNILGLMAIPPQNENAEKYFKSLSDLNSSLGLTELSMGMSSDYIQAINYKASYLRIGSAIFGDRS